jgi:hypothetical protein
MSRPCLVVSSCLTRFLFICITLRRPRIYCLIASCPVNPIIPLFSLGMLWYLHRLPLYYKRLVYYCLGSVVKSPVLYFPLLATIKWFTLLFVRCSAVTQLRSSSSQRHRLALYSRSKSRTHRLDGDIRLYSFSTMASSSDTRSTRVWLEDMHVALRRPHSAQASNERITFVSALDPRNK